jgi:hypothetical protein
MLIVGPNFEARGRAYGGLHNVAASRLRLGKGGGALKNINGAELRPVRRSTEAAERGRPTQFSCQIS